AFKDIGLIGVEGANGEIPTMAEAARPNPPLKRKIADFLIKQGELTGAEAYAIEQGRGELLWGVEDDKAYQTDQNLYLNHLQARKDLRTRLEFLEARVTEITHHLSKSDTRYENAAQAQQSLRFLIQYLSQQATDQEVVQQSRSLPEMMARVKALGLL